MRAQRVHYKKSGRKNLQLTSPGYAGWCASRNKVRARMGLAPIHRPSLAAAMDAPLAEGSQPTQVDLPQTKAGDSGGVGGGLSILSTIDENRLIGVVLFGVVGECGRVWLGSRRFRID